MTLLVSSTGSGVDEAVTRTSEMPRTVEMTVATLLSGLGSASMEEMAWAEALKTFVAYNQHEFDAISGGAHTLALNYINSTDFEKVYTKLFNGN